MNNKTQYPSATYGWYMVVLLTIAYIFSFLDRYILSYLVEPIKADLGIDDFQMGLLLGPAFGAFYALIGLPMGMLADRKRRTLIITAGITLWSAATALTGLAKNYFQVFIARMSVGIGEATLSPCAMSMISDSFPPERRGKPIGFYTAALSIGGGIAALLTAGILSWADEPVTLPYLGTLKPWQFTFILVGTPGLLIALLFLTLKEPPRQTTQQMEGVTEDQKAGLFDMLNYVFDRWKVFGSFIIFVCLMTITAYSHFFNAAMFERTWGWDSKTYAFWNAMVLLGVGPLTVNVAGALSDKLYKAGKTDAPLLILIAGAFIIVPTGVLFPLMPTPTLAMFVVIFNTLGIATASATGVTALLNIVPDAIKGQTVAFYYLVMSMAGTFIGPPMVGWLSEHVFSPEKLNLAVAMVPLFFGIPILMLAPFARRAYNAEYDRMHRESDQHPEWEPAT